MSEKYLIITDSGERPVKLIGPIEESQVSSIMIDMINEELDKVETDWALSHYEEMQVELTDRFEFEFGGGIYALTADKLVEAY